MNDFFVVYKEVSGEILKTLFMPETDVHMNYDEEGGERYITGEGYYERHYVHEGEIVPRPENPTVLEGQVLIDVPSDSMIRIDGMSYKSSEGGDIELSFNVPGIYIVRVESFPYLEKEFEIDYQPQP